MAKLFREGLRGERLKQTEIGEIPRSWQVVGLPELADLSSGGTPSKARPEFWSGLVPWLSPKDMKDLRLRDTEDHVSVEGVEAGSRMAPAKSIMIVVRGMILARDLPIGIIEVPMAFNQDMKAVIPRKDIESDFLLYAILSRKAALYAEIGTAAHGTRRIGTNSIERLTLPWPSDAKERQEIARILRTLYDQQRVAIERVGLLRQLFDSTLNSMMMRHLRAPAFEG